LPKDTFDPVPDDILERERWPGRNEALRTAHFPPSNAPIDDLNNFMTAAQRRLVFEDFFVFQTGLALRRKENAQVRKLLVSTVDDRIRQRAREVLPFKLTAGQRDALAEIVADMQRAWPMQRLLQGDVGAGKTIVALLAAVVAMENGFQVAVMAPTEILAEQHYRTIVKVLAGKPYRVALLSGRVTAATRRDLLPAIERGEVNLVVGTQALIQEHVKFKALALAVIDEQHRFGVMQRGTLAAKGANPDVLVMTATPIPRTLALTVYGDLSISTIREMPPGRQPIRTEVRDRRALPKIEAFLASEAAEGRQSFVVAPLVIASEALEAASAEAEAERLREALPGVRVALVHGQQRADLRDATMTAFAAGESDVLVATTVIEVGIDVPNASVMLIEDADRFGLAQLHQLRGRVGRGPHRSFCILLSDSTDALAHERLEVVRGSLDGFHIAEEDLRLRGAGNLLGTRQSGLPPLKVASLFDPRHLALAQRARDLADALVGAGQLRPELARMQAEFAPGEAEGDAA